MGHPAGAPGRMHSKEGHQTGHLMRGITALCLIGLVASTQAGTHAGTHQIEGRIVGVTDGDTITLLDADNRQHKIRLNGIDAPELGQPFGRASKLHLAELVANREAVAECSKTDRYGREVCRVLVGGADAGLEQLQAGLVGFVIRPDSALPKKHSHPQAPPALTTGRANRHTPARQSWCTATTAEAVQAGRAW